MTQMPVKTRPWRKVYAPQSDQRSAVACVLAARMFWPSGFWEEAKLVEATSGSIHEAAYASAATSAKSKKT